MSAVDRRVAAQTGIYADADLRRPPTGHGALDGQVFAAKDVFDIVGRVAGAGCPARAAIQTPATATAPVILRLLDAGARLAGMTVTEEMMFGVLGQGAGMPCNPLAPRHLAGGSSTGSAVAVARRLCDFALGTDTGGSVRVPASFCGIYGLRPSHSDVSTTGVVPLAPQFDTVGWFASTAYNLAEIGSVLLRKGAALPVLRAVWVPPEITEGLDPALNAALFSRADALAALLDVPLATVPIGSAPASWGRAWKALQGSASWETHGTWIETQRPALGPVAARRFAAARAVSAAEIEAGNLTCTKLKRAVLPRLESGWLLVTPTTPGPAPTRDAPETELEQARTAILSRTALAGLLGLPELTAPWLSLGDLPVGLSMIGSSGTDTALLLLAQQSAAALSETQHE